MPATRKNLAVTPVTLQRETGLGAGPCDVTAGVLNRSDEAGDRISTSSLELDGHVAQTMRVTLQPYGAAQPRPSRR